jgi:hypothetical protein
LRLSPVRDDTLKGRSYEIRSLYRNGVESRPVLTMRTAMDLLGASAAREPHQTYRASSPHAKRLMVNPPRKMTALLTVGCLLLAGYAM